MAVNSVDQVILLFVCNKGAHLDTRSCQGDIFSKANPVPYCERDEELKRLENLGYPTPILAIASSRLFSLTQQKKQVHN